MTKSDAASDWAAEVRDDRTVVMTHTAGHRLVFHYPVGRGHEDECTSRLWAADADHDAEYRLALSLARKVGVARGWRY